MMLCSSVSAILFLSTPSARRATQDITKAPQTLAISIHALREEGDSCSSLRLRGAFNFYPRPPRGGRPPGRRDTAGHWNFYPRPPRGGRPYVAGYVTKKTYDFYPRPPRGGRLRHSSKLQQDKGYFYPRPPRGGRPSLAFSLLCNREISIHALREEGDGCSIDLGHIVDVFLSTPSARRATAECIRTRL